MITRDVPDDALAVERGEQTVRTGWAKRFREANRAARSRQAAVSDDVGVNDAA